MDDKTLLEAIDDIIRFYAEQSSRWFIDEGLFNRYTRWLHIKELVIADRIWKNMKLSEFLPSETDYENSFADSIYSQIQKHTVLVLLKPKTLEKLKKYMLNENKTISEVIEMWSENND